MARAADGGDLSLTTFLESGAERHLTAEVYAEGPGGLLAAAAGVDRFPIGCATPLMMPAGPSAPPAHEAMRQLLAALAAPAASASQGLLVARDGRFVVAYPTASATRRDFEPSPETVARAAEALVAARAYLVSTLGYPDPAPDGAQIMVHLARLGRGLEGFALPPDSATGAAASIVLDASLSDDRWMSAALHQVAHLSLQRAAPSASWWSEATAAWLTLRATGDLEAQREALEARLKAPSRGLHADGLRLMQGTLLWPLFLAERTGDPDVVRQIWEEMAAGTHDPVVAADQVLEGRYGLSATAALREMAIWNLFTAGRDDGRHYSGGHAFPEAALDSVDPALPLHLGPVEPVDSLGSIAFRLPAGRVRGTLDLDLTASGGRPAADLLVFLHDEATPVLVPVPLDGGSGAVSLPWGQAREAWIILRNEEQVAGADPSRFDLQARNDPAAPFDLAAFTAEAVGRSVLLQWTTAAEKGLVGWNIHRSERPTGPFQRLNGVAIPAYGERGAETGYLFADDDARPGRRYYYVIEGLTAAGLVERSHVASVRTPRSAS